MNIKSNKNGFQFLIKITVNIQSWDLCLSIKEMSFLELYFSFIVSKHVLLQCYVLNMLSSKIKMSDIMKDFPDSSATEYFELCFHDKKCLCCF